MGFHAFCSSFKAPATIARRTTAAAGLVELFQIMRACNGIGAQQTHTEFERRALVGDQSRLRTVNGAYIIPGSASYLSPRILDPLFLKNGPRPSSRLPWAGA